jgi:hypothetical protein
MVSRILFETTQTLFYLTLRSWSFPGSVAMRLLPWHILLSLLFAYLFVVCLLVSIVLNVLSSYSTIHHAVPDHALIVFNNA